MVKAGCSGGFGGGIEALDTAAQHTAYLPQVITGELFGCFAMTETAHQRGR